MQCLFICIQQQPAWKTCLDLSARFFYSLLGIVYGYIFTKKGMGHHVCIIGYGFHILSNAFPRKSENGARHKRTAYQKTFPPSPSEPTISRSLFLKVIALNPREKIKM